jgi:hypothetical protein
VNQALLADFALPGASVVLLSAKIATGRLYTASLHLAVGARFKGTSGAKFVDPLNYYLHRPTDGGKTHHRQSNAFAR